MKTISNYSESVRKIRSFLKDYIIEHNLKSLIIGVSGGVDSTLVCALAYPVAKELGIELIGRSITIESNKEDEIIRAKNVGYHFTTCFREVDLTKEYNVLKDFLSSEKTSIDHIETERESKIRLGNTKARIRMIHLYDLAQRNKGLVLSTDNYTEFLLGFWTLHGDVGDYGMIQNLWKTEVYEMTGWIAKNEDMSMEASNALISTLDAVATDGLGITNSDLDQILPDWTERHKTTRQGYKEVDEVLDSYLIFIRESTISEILENKEIRQHPIVKRKLSSEFKRNNPINIKRENII